MSEGGSGAGAYRVSADAFTPIAGARPGAGPTITVPPSWQAYLVVRCARDHEHDLSAAGCAGVTVPLDPAGGAGMVVLYRAATGIHPAELTLHRM